MIYIYIAAGGLGVKQFRRNRNLIFGSVAAQPHKLRSSHRDGRRLSRTSIADEMRARSTGGGSWAGEQPRSAEIYALKTLSSAPDQSQDQLQDDCPDKGVDDRGDNANAARMKL